MESRDTGLSANVNLNEMVIKLTVLLGCKGRKQKTHFKVHALGHECNIFKRSLQFVQP